MNAVIQLNLETQRQWGASCLLLLCALFWGVTFTVVKQAIAQVEVFVFLAQRFTLASLLLLPFCAMRGVPLTAPILREGLLLGLLLFGAFAFQTVGLQYTSASNAGFVTGMNVVLVPLLGTVLTGDPIPRLARLGVMLCAVGLFLLCMGDTWAFNRGDLLVLVCALCVALQVICTGRFARESDVMWLTGIQLGVVAGLSVLTAAIRGHSVLAWEPRVFWAIVICAVFATVFAFLVQTAMQRYTTATQTALIFCTEPVFGALYAFLAADERLGAWGLVGALLIFAGMVVAELPFSGSHSLTPAASLTQPKTGRGAATSP